MQSATDVPLLIRSENSASERRVSPAWTIAQFKARLEPITGVPATCQRLTISLGRSTSQQSSAVELTAADEEETQLVTFSLQPYAEIHVADTRPAHMRTAFNDVSSVEKYTMPMQEYEQKNDSVLAYKKQNKLGRFDPNLPNELEQQRRHIDREIQERHIEVGKRCRLLPESTDDRRGEVAYVGEIEGLPGVGKWIGIRLDEPTGKNDGSVASKRFFEAAKNHGAFVRPEKVEIGSFPIRDELEDSDMEEI